uniref:Uncharacterized protein n=1 Tax=Glossina morsitans morsitans TaxID=37546 RepID=A0A1B0FPB7_GLOMM
MDMRSWKNILLQWISECGFAERNFFNLEQSDIEKFYLNFSKKHHKIASGNCPELWDFLQQFYPEFDVNRDDDDGLSSADYIYVYSLMLHFSCVKYPQTFFHDICQKIPSSSQQSMALFFRELLEVEKLYKEDLRRAVAEVVVSHAPSRCSDSISRRNGGLTPGTNIKTDSPSLTPKRNIGTKRNSSLTPKTHLLEERTRELFALRAQLDTERYEKDLLEIQIKQNEDKILKLSQDRKKLVKQIQGLKIDVLMKTSGNNSAVDCEGEERNQAQHGLVKEISEKYMEKENEVKKLSETLRTTEEDKSRTEDKITYNGRHIEICGERIKLLEFEINDLTEEIEKRDSTIKYLTDAKVELEQFIAETRVVGSIASIEVDLLFSHASEVFSESSPNEAENLAVSVIDKQLREKEHENAQLREELRMLNGNNKLLAERLQELIKSEMSEFKITSDDLSESDLEADNWDPIAQFNMFASSMEKINMHHQLEKNKIKSLEHEIIVSQKENLELVRKLDSMLVEANLLKNDLNAFEHNNKELQETKERLQNSLHHCKAELKNSKEQLANSEKVKEGLTEEINALKTKLHQTENINAELTGSNSQLKEQLEGLQNKLQDLQDKWMTQTKCLEEQIKVLDDQLQNQSKELEVFQDAELALKIDYERHLRASGNELKNAKTNLENSEKNIEKLTNENEKLRESHQATTKRIERMAVKLSDAQASSIKLEREKEKLCKTLEANLATLETLQKEKDFLQSESRALKERLSYAERGHLQLLAKVQNLEHINRTLQDAKQKLEASDINDKTKINELEKVNESNEQKVRELTASLNRREHSNATLNLEIGGLNSQLQKLNSELSAKYKAQIEQIQRHLSGAQEQAHKYAELNHNLINQINELQDQYAKIDEQLSKVSLSLSISKERCDKLCNDMEQLRADLLVLRKTKAKAEREQEIINQSLKDMHARNEQLTRERDSLAESLIPRIGLLEDQIKQKTEEVENLQNELKQLREKTETQSLELTEGKKATATKVVELEELRTRLSNMNEALEKEQQLNEQLRSDNQLLHGKYQDANQHAAEATVNSGERVKGNRLELEKILEKMKAKFKRILRK